MSRVLVIFLAATFMAGAVMCGGGEAEAPVPPSETGQPAEPEMTQEQKLEYVFANCVCAKCPSWTPECAEKGEKGGYCAVGKSECITEEKGCICGDCPVAEKLGLKWGYYCTRGSAEEMMEKEAEMKTEEAGG